MFLGIGNNIRRGDSASRMLERVQLRKKSPVRLWYFVAAHAGSGEAGHDGYDGEQEPHDEGGSREISVTIRRSVMLSWPTSGSLGRTGSK